MLPNRPRLPSDGLADLPPATQQVIALEDHLARETRSSQALAARVAELEALCKVLGVAAELPASGEPIFLPLADVRANDTLRQSMINAAWTKAEGDHARGPRDVRMCAAAMVIRRIDNGEAEVLLMRRGPSAPYGVGAWTLPAGGAKPADASLVDTAARELCEETGLVFTSPRVVRLVDGLTPTTGGFPFACAVVLGTARNSYAATNCEPDIHDDIAWFTRDTLPASTWDRAMLVDILDREEEAHWTTDTAGNPSITQCDTVRRADFFRAIADADKGAQ